MSNYQNLRKRFFNNNSLQYLGDQIKQKTKWNTPQNLWKRSRIEQFFFFFQKFTFSSFRIFWAIRPYLLFRTVIFFFALKPGIVPPQYRRTVTITIKITKRTNQYLQKIISLQLTQKFNFAINLVTSLSCQKPLKSRNKKHRLFSEYKVFLPSC